MRYAMQVALAAALVLVSTPLAAQEPDHAQHHMPQEGLPDGWTARFDQAHAGHEGHAPEGLSFTEMAPGWHVTTGPSGIFFRHDARAEGSYRIESQIFLFDPGERREAFGIFVGGRELHGEDQRYTYFIIRRTGEFMIRRREGDEVHDVQGWTAHDAVKGWDDLAPGDQTVPNVLAVEVGPDEVVFLVNDREVMRHPREGLEVDGHYGLRVNHALNLHVTGIEVTRRDG